MARIPMTAAEQLQLARRYGHELSIEHGQRVVCTCGYRSTMRLTRATLNATMAWHLGKVISEALDEVDGQRVPPGRQQAGGAGAPSRPGSGT